jgi:hypothetical protein
MAHTKKHKKSIMTIPQLRKAFDHIESFTTGLLQREKDPKKRRQAFQEEWMKVFHHAVDEKATDAYLQFEAKKTKGSKTRRSRQRGGAALSGAPLDYSTRPGIYGVYGTFPEYISGGFATMGNATNKMAIQEDCNSAAAAAKWQAPYTGFGAASLAQNGGKRKSRKGRGRKTRRATTGQRGGAPTWGEFASAASLRPFTSSAPPSQLHTTLMEWKGAEPYPSSLANTGSPAYRGIPAQIQTPTAGAITRNLASEL